MDAEERAKRFAREVERQQANLPRIQKNTLQEVVRQLEQAERHVTELLQSKPTDSAQRRLRALQREVERVMEDFRQASTSSAIAGDQAAWSAGQQTIVAPFGAAGVSLSGQRIDARALMASQQFLTTRIEAISVRGLNRLNSALMQNVAGVESLGDTITAVQRILGGAPRADAMRVVYTEIGRVHSIAQHERLQEAGHIVPGLRKRWLKSGKRHPRMDHVRAHNQIVRFDEPFLVAGERLMFPRDPSGSAGNTINCGCLSAPVVDGSSFGLGSVRIDDDGAARIESRAGGMIRQLP